MKKICLDTDFLVALLRNRSDAVARASDYDSINASISTTSMNVFELYLGAFRSREMARNVAKVDELCQSLRVLDQNWESSKKSGEVLSELLKIGQPIGLRDAIIAGIALANGCTLVTRNLRHFQTVVGLNTETW